jgi:hypothetical protein
VWINKSVKIASSSPCCNPSHQHQKRFFFTEIFWWGREFSIIENEKDCPQNVDVFIMNEG